VLQEISVKNILCGDARTRRLERLIRTGKSPPIGLLKREYFEAVSSEAGNAGVTAESQALETSAFDDLPVRRQLVEEGFRVGVEPAQTGDPAVARIFDGEKKAN